MQFLTEMSVRSLVWSMCKTMVIVAWTFRAAQLPCLQSVVFNWELLGTAERSNGVSRGWARLTDNHFLQPSHAIAGIICYTHFIVILLENWVVEFCRQVSASSWPLQCGEPLYFMGWLLWIRVSDDRQSEWFWARLVNKVSSSTPAHQYAITPAAGPPSWDQLGGCQYIPTS